MIDMPERFSNDICMYICTYKVSSVSLFPEEAGEGGEVGGEAGGAERPDAPPLHAGLVRIKA